MERMKRQHPHQAPREELPPPAIAVAEPEAGEETAAEPVSSVQVIYGASVHEMPLAGLRISQCRPLVETILRVDPQSPAVVNGQIARPDRVLARGDVLEFVHHAGEKGLANGPAH